MQGKTIDKRDLSYRYNHRGYMMLYKGQPIGGAGILSHIKKRNTRQNRDFFKEQAELTKRDIMLGRISQWTAQRIEEIEKNADHDLR